MKMIKQLSDMRRSDGSLKTISTAGYTPKNFNKIYFNQAIPLLNTFANKPTQILLFFLQNADENNMIYCTYKDIMQACNIKDKNTISNTLKQLMEMEAITKLSTSHYMINPAITHKGNCQRFGTLAIYFNERAFERKRTHPKKGINTL